MQEMNGYDTTIEIMKIENRNSLIEIKNRTEQSTHDSRIPIIALTAGTVKGEKEKCLAVGMDDYLSKPIVVEALKAIINKWIK